ncbi:magnesium chelatase family protein [Stackebrandtia endophytica]|uniref:Magnesium chelatase family protein n=1 Tax=Stackebrandtia endophytica TaxID=1496996 RepID=A0A543B1V7_9ACTN|nr:YifB family Mg chelatase-like AAA ATPase [Stackebrandtia endophytica]TQL78710.1 magnesium chelatase family protein [Stackebrandtia endophytica]
MRYSTTRSACLVGVTGHPVTVEVHIGSGSSVFVLTGLPDRTLDEAKVRVRAAFEHAELHFPDSYTVVNLLPAGIPKTGAGCDLAIAVGVLTASQQIPRNELASTVFLGELGLNGAVRPVPGILPCLLAAVDAGASTALVPTQNAMEASMVPHLTVIAVDGLPEVIAHLRGEHTIQPTTPRPPPPPPAQPDMAEIAGQQRARRALEIAAAGGHHLFMLGPPGSGKTMLAERLPSLLPPLSDRQALEVTALRSATGLLPEHGGLIRHPTFSAPHHTATMPAMVGGGSSSIRPGAISEAHHGVLFLDEAPEFRREVLDALRQPLESHEVIVCRSRGTARFPARLQLVLAANPCPCGRTAECQCSPATRRRYLGRLSGPLLDRVDIRLELASVESSQLISTRDRSEGSAEIAERVATARSIARDRWNAVGQPWSTNHEVPGPYLRDAPWRLPATVTGPADWMVETGALTARGYDRVLRLAWTLCDLAGRSTPTVEDIAEATGLRVGHQLPG